MRHIATSMKGLSRVGKYCVDFLLIFLFAQILCYSDMVKVIDHLEQNNGMLGSSHLTHLSHLGSTM